MSETANEVNDTHAVDGQRPSLDGDHDPHYEPIITLPEVKVPTLEEEETVLHRVRAKLFRHDKVNKEWKERGTGEAKLLFHEKKKTIRIIMRRDKTLKLCANHYVTPDMKLELKNGTDRVWLWTTSADVSDGVPKSEVLAMRFMNAEAANNWFTAFEEAKAKLDQDLSKAKGDDSDEKDEGVSSQASSSEDELEVTEKVQSLSINKGDSKATENCDNNTEKKDE